MNKFGKIGKANQKARTIISQMAEELGLYSCEIGFSGCMGNFGVAPAHRMKRVFYNGDVERLSDYNEWVAACQYCHDKIEDDRELTKQTFERLRP